MENRRFLFETDPLYFTQPRTIAVRGFRENNEPIHFITHVDYDEYFKVKKNESNVPQTLKPYEDNEAETVNCEELQDNFNIKCKDDGTYKLSLHISPKLFGYLIGTKGMRRKEIENSTGAKLKIPNRNDSGDVIITGDTERKVVSAANRVTMLALAGRSRYPATHFVSIPASSANIIQNFLKFKEQILSEHVRGVDEKLFQKPEKLHITVTTLTLLDEEDIAETITALNEYKNSVWDTLFQHADDLKIIMKGIEIMNDEPQNVDVLYGKVEIEPHKYNANFQKFLNGIVDVLARKGLIQKQYDNVKVHVTLMNSLFKKGDNEDGNRETFNCENILTKYKNYNFGSTELKSLHLSVRYTVDDNGYYEPATIIPLTKET